MTSPRSPVKRAKGCSPALLGDEYAWDECTGWDGWRPRGFLIRVGFEVEAAGQAVKVFGVDVECACSFRVAAVGVAQGVENQIFLGLVEDVVVAGSDEPCGLFFENSLGQIFAENLVGEPGRTMACSIAFSSSRTFPGQL